jgi:hypothetical protein
MKNTILDKIQNNQHVLIVGKESSGKTHFAKNDLLPFLTVNNLKTAYFNNCNDLDTNTDSNVLIIDEVELLGDKNFLEQQHPDQSPYYPEAYLSKVKKWHEKLSEVKKPSIYIVTRNTDSSIDNIVNNYQNLEWNDLPIQVLKFKK